MSVAELNFPCVDHRHQMHAAVEQFCMSEPEFGEDEACTQGEAKRRRHHYDTNAEGASICSKGCVGGKRSSDAGDAEERPLKVKRPG